MPRPMKRSTFAHLLLLGVVMLWGAMFVVVKDALRDITPLLFNLLRMTLAFLCLAIVYRKHWPRLKPRDWASGAVVGFFLAMGFQFQTIGLTLTSPTKSAFITGLVVVMVPLLCAIPGLRPAAAHRPRWNSLLGAAMAFAGLVLLTTPAHTQWSKLLSSLNLGDILTFGCAVGFAFHVLAIAHTSRRVDFAALAMLQIGFCAVAMAVTLPLFEHPHLVPTLRLGVAIAVAALLATALAFSIQTYAQQHLPPTHTALLIALEPVFAWLTAWLVLHETMGARGGAGAALVLGGILVTELIRSGPEAIEPVHTAHEAG